MISASWNDIKDFLTSRSLGCQWLSLSGKYHIYAFDGPFQLKCAIQQTDPKNAEQIDFEDNYKTISKSNQSPSTTVTTQYEKNDKDLKLARAAAPIDVATKQAIVYLKIPGTQGDPFAGRYNGGGEAIINNFVEGDFATVYVEDRDRLVAWGVAMAANPNASEPFSDAQIRGMGVLPAPFNEAFPDYPTVKSYTDDELPPENQGWYFYPEARGGNLEPYGILEITPIGGYGFGPPGFYLKIIFQRLTSDPGEARINVFWGKKGVVVA